MLPLALALASVLHAGQNADLARAIQQLHDLDERGALKSLELARRQPGISREELAQVHLYTGLAKAELFGQKEATKAFRAALDLDPNIRLPRTASPLVRGWWEELGGMVEAPPALVPPPPGPPPAPVVVTERVVVHDTAPLPPSRTHRWVGVSIAALGVGVIAAALVLGARAAATQRQSISETDIALSQSEHASAVQQAQTANKVGVVGGGLAIAGGVVFVW